MPQQQQNFSRYVSTWDRKPTTTYIAGVRFEDTIKVNLHQKGLYAALPIEPWCDRKNPLKEVKTFIWGENSPAVLQLSYTLLRQAKISESRTKASYQAFCEEVIATINYWKWTITLKDVKCWVKEWEEEQAYLRQIEAAKPRSIAP